MAGDHEGRIESGYDCGTLSLHLLLGLEGRRPDFAAIAQAMPGGPRRAHSLQDLSDVAARFGLPLRGVHLSGTGYGSGRPILIFLNREPHGHFAIARRVGHSGRLSQIIDPSDEPRVVDIDRLNESPEWTGDALVPAQGMGSGRLIAASGLAILAATLGGRPLWRRLWHRPQSPRSA